MTKTAALHKFFSSFGITAYTTASVPDDVTLPYLTYDLVTGAWDSGPVSITVNLWYYTESEAIPNTKAEEISKAIGIGGVTLRCDDGLIWLKRGSPWCQSIKDDAFTTIKRRYLNFTAEYLTL